jgi:hypothetical protein
MELKYAFCVIMSQKAESYVDVHHVNAHTHTHTHTAFIIHILIVILVYKNELYAFDHS